jgi:hypothetical protein
MPVNIYLCTDYNSLVSLRSLVHSCQVIKKVIGMRFSRVYHISDFVLRFIKYSTAILHYIGWSLRVNVLIPTCMHACKATLFDKYIQMTAAE